MTPGDCLLHYRALTLAELDTLRAGVVRCLPNDLPYGLTEQNLQARLNVIDMIKLERVG